MFHARKNSQNAKAKSELNNRRKSRDRRVSNSEIRFPFVDDESKLVMKDRRISDRRVEDIRANPLKALKKFI